MEVVERSLRALETIAEMQPVGVGELARVLNVPKSTMQRTLQTLATAGWIQGDGGAYTRWRLTTRALSVAHKASGDLSLRSVAIEPMRELRDLINETITLQVRDGRNRMVQVERVDSTQAVRTFWQLGATTPLAVTSTGLAVLAALDDSEVDDILLEPIDKLTSRTATSPRELRARVKETRKRGYATNRGQNREGVCAVGAAIFDSTGAPIAGVGISMPESRFDEEKLPLWGEQVKATAATITRFL